MKSRGFHLRIRDLICSIIVLGLGTVGVGVLVYDLLQSLVVASDSVVTIVVVCVVCPYS